MAGLIKTEDTESEAGSISEEERIRKLFQACDGDGDGYIDSEDLLSICRELNLEQCVGELMQELGADEQGRISYQGFLRRRLELAGQVEAAARCLGGGRTAPPSAEGEEGAERVWGGCAECGVTHPQGEEGGHRDGGGFRRTTLVVIDSNVASGRQQEYQQPTSSENSLGAGSGGRQERWEFDSGARDLSPEPQAPTPPGPRSQQQVQGIPATSQGPLSNPTQTPSAVNASSPIPQGGTASLLDMANKLHQAALSSLKSEIQDLTGQLKAVTQERDFLERSLSKSQLEKLRVVHDAEERLEAQAQRYEGRLTELHCVIAELSRKIRGQTSRVITEEEEVDEEDSITAADEEDDDDDEEEEEEQVEGEEEEEGEDGAGSQSVAADTMQDDLSGVGGEEGGEMETQDCCEMESGRTELVDGDGTVVPDDATDHTQTHDLVVTDARREEEGLEQQQQRLHRKVKELQGNLQQLQITAPAVVHSQPKDPPLAVAHIEPRCWASGVVVQEQRPCCPSTRTGNAIAVFEAYLDEYRAHNRSEENCSCLPPEVIEPYLPLAEHYELSTPGKETDSMKFVQAYRKIDGDMKKLRTTPVAGNEKEADQGGAPSLTWDIERNRKVKSVAMAIARCHQQGPLPKFPEEDCDPVVREAVVAVRERQPTAEECGNVCCNSRTVKYIARDMLEESSAQELRHATRCGIGEDNLSTPWGQGGGAVSSQSHVMQLPLEVQLEGKRDLEHEEDDSSPGACGCLPVLQALELEVERQTSRAEAQRTSAELTSLSLEECRSACERQALLLSKRGSDIVGLTLAISYALPLCRAIYVLSRLLDIGENTARTGSGAEIVEDSVERLEQAKPKGVIPESGVKGSNCSGKGPERPCRKRHGDSGCAESGGSGEAERARLCGKRGEDEGKMEEGALFVDEGGYGKIKRALEVACGPSSRRSGPHGPSDARRAVQLEATTLVESLDCQMRVLQMGGMAMEGALEDDWVLTSADFLWLESLGSEEDGSPNVLRRLGRHISVLLKRLSSCGIGLKRARTMAAEASASEGELGLLPPEAFHCPTSQGQSSRKADLEVAVLMQELMAMREERVVLRARVHELEGGKGRKGEAEVPGSGAGCPLPPRSKRGADGRQPGPPHTPMATTKEHLKLIEEGGDSMSAGRVLESSVRGDGGSVSREQWLEGRLQELALTLEQVANSADLRLRQSTAVMNDLRRTNGTLAHSLDRCRRRYQQRLRTLEAQMENLMERHASQVRTLRLRISQLEGKSSTQGGKSCKVGSAQLAAEEVSL